MPPGYMDAWLQVGKNYQEGAKQLGSSIISAASMYGQGVTDRKLASESAPTVMSQYQQSAQTSGQAVDPTLVERYSKISEMSGPQIQQFNKDVMAANQQNMALFNLQRQQQVYQMQQQAMQRAAQAQDLATRRSNIINVLGGASNYQPAMPQGTGQLPTINPLFPTY